MAQDSLLRFFDPGKPLRDVIEKLLEACPDTEWRLIIALARCGGLRIPSEALALTWAGIDWAHGRFRVRSPKTEHHEGRVDRQLRARGCQALPGGP